MRLRMCSKDDLQKLLAVGKNKSEYKMFVMQNVRYKKTTLLIWHNPPKANVN